MAYSSSAVSYCSFSFSSFLEPDQDQAFLTLPVQEETSGFLMLEVLQSDLTSFSPITINSLEFPLKIEL